jgi:hypothetical protein
MPDAGQHGDLILLELHPGAAAVAEAAAGQLTRNVRRGDVDAGNHAFDHGHQRAAVGLTSSGPSQHASHLPMSRISSRNPPSVDGQTVQDAVDLADGVATGLPENRSWHS